MPFGGSNVQRVGLMLAVAAGLTLSSVGPATAQEFYRGKRLTVIVGLAAGGGIDATARMFTRHFAKHIEGAPNIVVQNMPGAAGATAMGYLGQRAPKDGTTIMFDSWMPLTQITRPTQIGFDYRTMTLIGALRGGTWIVFARKDAVAGGLSHPADIAKAQDLVYAGQQPALILDMHGRLSLNLLKLRYKYVSGYPGATAIRLALERGEAHVTTHGLQGYRSGVEPTLVKNGTVMPLYYFQRRSLTGDYLVSPLVPEIPPFLDVYREVHGGRPSGTEWDALELITDLYGNASNFVWGPPGMDPAALPPLRKAFAAAMVDPEFLAEQEKTTGHRHEHVSAAEIQQIMARFGNVEPRLVEFFQKFMR